ncbi:hypothetical protein OG21DRAFT_1482764 [Imleria badia]|nr:hypothetical protein OG21DRAFT_1482764 [Imleria badia]
MFECGRHEDAISRVDGLIGIMDDHSLYVTVRAQMFLLLGSISMREGNNERAIDLFKRAQEAVPFQEGPHLVVITLMFGWDFDRLSPAIQLQLFKAMHAVGHTEVAMSLSTMIGIQSDNAKEAIVQYSTALYLNPSNPAGLLVKRSKARAMLGLWEDALMDADQAIKANPTGPFGYERRHAVLHSVQRYDEAIDAFTRMISLIEESIDQDLRQLGEKYVSPSRSKTAIEGVVREVSKITPIVLIDIESGRLCDGPKRLHIFKSGSQFKELVSSMTEKLDDERILRVVKKYFQYVTFSHVWAGEEPSFQDVNLVSSVWDLDSSPLNEKLKRFCEMVRKDGYRWAWSDTCCIDKTTSTVLNQSLMMMYKWYEASAATFILLADIDSPSALGKLTKSRWMTRAWTAQELLAAKVIRFYDRNWNPYLGDTHSNQKDSPEIMQELADATGIARETIITFNRERSYDCLPAVLAVYSQTPRALTPVNDTEMDVRVGALRDSLSDTDVIPMHERVARLPPARFANRRLHLPCAIFAVNKLSVQRSGSGLENHYRARVSGIGNVEFQTSDQLSLTEPRRLIFVHPWIRDLQDPLDGSTWGSTTDGDEYDSDAETEFGSAPSSPLAVEPAVTLDNYTRVLRLVVRLQQPFHALLLQQQLGGEFKRVAAEHEIVVPGIEHTINFARDVRIEVVEIL